MNNYANTAEDLLNSNKLPLWSIFDEGQIGLVKIDPDFRFVESNEAFCRMIGYSKEELMRLTIKDITHPYYLEREFEALNKLIRGDIQIYKAEECYTRKDQTTSNNIVTVSAIHDINGEFLYFFTIIEDITDRKRTEEALKLSEAKFRSLFENMVEGFAYCRMLYENEQPLDFIYLDVNQSFERLTGLKGVTGRRASEVIPGIRETDPQLFEIYSRAALTGIPERFETYIKALKMWIYISVYSPLREHFVTVFEVITDRKKTEEAYRESEEKYNELV